MDYVIPKGGYTPINPHSLAMADTTDWAWYQKKAFMHRLGTTNKSGRVNPGDYVAIYFTGGHRVIWDFPDNQELQAIKDQFDGKSIPLAYFLFRDSSRKESHTPS